MKEMEPLKRTQRQREGAQWRGAELDSRESRKPGYEKRR